MQQVESEEVLTTAFAVGNRTFHFFSGRERGLRSFSCHCDCADSLSEGDCFRAGFSFGKRQGESGSKAVSGGCRIRYFYTPGFEETTRIFFIIHSISALLSAPLPPLLNLLDELPLPVPVSVSALLHQLRNL